MKMDEKLSTSGSFPASHSDPPHEALTMPQTPVIGSRPEHSQLPSPHHTPSKILESPLMPFVAEQIVGRMNF